MSTAVPEIPNTPDGESLSLNTSTSSLAIPTTDPSQRNGILFRINSKIDRSMRYLFYRLGYFVANHPRRIILIGVLFTLVTLAGMARFRTESRPEELWVPQGTEALRDQEYVEQRFPDEERVANLIFTRRGGNGDSNVATKKRLLEMVEVVRKGEKVRASGSGIADRCKITRDGTRSRNRLCLSTSPLDLFYEESNIVMMERRPNEEPLVDFSETVRRGIEALGEDQVKDRLENGPFNSIDGRPFEKADFIANATGSGSSFKAQAFMYRLFLNNNLTLDGGDRRDKDAEEWEEEWTKVLLDASEDSSQELEWKVNSFWGQLDSLDQALTSDLPLLSGGFTLLFLFIVLFLGDFHSVRSRMICALVGLLTAGLALGTMFGLSSLFGMFFGPVHTLLPFLILGIAADDIFIVTQGLKCINREDRNRGKSAEQRVALALSEAGTAITVTSFTNTLVFLIGSITSLGALRFFSLWAAIGIFAAWVYTITVFTAYLTIDQKRIDVGRYDCFPCRKASRIKERNWLGKLPGSFSRFMGNYFAPFVMRKPVAVVLLILILGLFGVSIWGTTRLYLKFEFSFFYPDGSSQKEYQDTLDKHFPEKQRTKIYIRDIDYGAESNQKKMLNLCKEDGLLENDPFIDGGSVDCWYMAFRASRSISSDSEFVPEDSFVTDLKNFLSSAQGARFETDVNIAGNKITSSRFSARHIPLNTNDEEIDAMQSLRKTVAKGNIGPNGEDAFPYTFAYIFFEQYAALPREIGISLGLAMVAVIAVSFLLIGHPIVALIAVISVGMILIDILGFLNFTDININSVSVINLVLATGLSVDTVSHICRGFLEKIGDRKRRAISSLRDLGQPVFYASFSTFLTIILLAGAKSYVFRVFFRLFVAIIIGGLIHGFLFAPIVLRFIGPRAFYATTEEKEKATRELESLFGNSNAEDAISEVTQENV